MVKRSRPVHPYLYVAAFAGRGDPNEAAGWMRGPAVPVALPDWAGDSYFAPYRSVAG